MPRRKGSRKRHVSKRVRGAAARAGHPDRTDAVIKSGINEDSKSNDASKLPIVCTNGDCTRSALVRSSLGCASLPEADADIIYCAKSFRQYVRAWTREYNSQLLHLQREIEALRCKARANKDVTELYKKTGNLSPFDNARLKMLKECVQIMRTSGGGDVNPIKKLVECYQKMGDSKSVADIQESFLTAHMRGMKRAVAIKGQDPQVKSSINMFIANYENFRSICLDPEMIKVSPKSNDGEATSLKEQLKNFIPHKKREKLLSVFGNSFNKNFKKEDTNGRNLEGLLISLETLNEEMKTNYQELCEMRRNVHNYLHRDRSEDAQST